jgi:ectoine hydroxylase-related dioxygenase (phytanoyl-CoA dioxygenase family)
MVKAQLARIARSARRAMRGMRPVDFAEPLRGAKARRSGYESLGFAAGPRLAGPVELARLRAEFERIFEGTGGAPRPVSRERLDDGAGGEFFKLYNLHRASFAFLELVSHPGLVSAAAEITGCRRFRVLLDELFYKPARSGGWNGWHRDMPSFPLVPPYTALTAWIALDDATPASGCLSLVPGSHAWGDAADLAGDDWGLGGRLPEFYAGQRVRVVERPVRAGWVHFHHERVWHSSSPNRSRNPRRALAVLLFDADARYRCGGRIRFPGLAHGSSLESIAPLVLGA